MQKEFDWQTVYAHIKETEEKIIKGRIYSPDETKRILHERAIKLAHHLSESESAQQTGILTFMIAREKYAIPVTQLDQICKLKNFTILPSVPKFIAGIMNIHGKIICIYDLKVLFNLKKTTSSPKQQHNIIVHDGETQIGLIADEITGIQFISPQDLQSAETLLSNEWSSLIEGITDEQVILLNIHEIISSPKLVINQLL